MVISQVFRFRGSGFVKAHLALEGEVVSQELVDVAEAYFRLKYPDSDGNMEHLGDQETYTTEEIMQDLRDRVQSLQPS